MSFPSLDPRPLSSRSSLDLELFEREKVCVHGRADCVICTCQQLLKELETLCNYEAIPLPSLTAPGRSACIVAPP